MWWGTPQQVREARAACAGTEPPAALGAGPGQLDVDVGQMPPSSLSLGDGLRGLLERSELCDVAFAVEGERLPAHRAMVAAMSSTFRAFLASGCQESANTDDPMKGALRRPARPPVAAAVPQEEVVQASPPPAEGATGAAVASDSAPAPAAATAAPATEGGAPSPEAQPSAPSSTETAAPSAQPSSLQSEERAAASPAGGGPPVAPASAASYEAPAGPLELEVTCASSAEAVRILLRYIYFAGTGADWQYQPSTSTVNKDVLHLARVFALPHLHEYAARWLAQGLNTANVVERLVTCEECALGLLRDRILERLAANPSELAVVSSSPEIMKHPRILQDLLVLVATSSERSTKKADKQAETKAEKQAEKQAQKAAKEAEKLAEKQPEKPPEKAEKEKPEKAAPERPAKRVKRAASAA